MKNIFDLFVAIPRCRTPRLRTVTAAVLAVAFAAAPAGAYERLEGTLDQSDIYPGTRHTFVVTLPDGYDAVGADTAALYVGLDGILCDAPAVFDRLHAAGKMPATVGVFLQPGTVQDAAGRTVRWNRSNEFDATDSLFATFLDTELLPAVRRLTDARGHAVRFTDRPGRRMIFGLSSGGIAAFTAAWHRPDLFGMVFTGCATLVPMRGGHNLQAVVRKHEPKPLRLMIQDTYHDTWNPLFGSWYEANVLMAGALQFAGYDVRTDWTEGVHSVSGSAAIFDRVMEWMWATDSIPVGTTANNFLNPLLIPGRGWERITDAGASIRKSTGDVAKTAATPALSVGAGIRQALWPDSSILAKTEPGTNFIKQYIVSPEGEHLYGQRFYWLHTYDNSVLPVGGMAFDGAGNLWAVTGAGLQIADQNGRVRGILDLPRGIDPTCTAISLTDGMVTLFDADGKPAWRRALHLVAPVAGSRPASQGPA